MKTQKSNIKYIFLLLSFLTVIPMLASRHISLRESKWDKTGKSLSPILMDACITDGNQSILLTFYSDLGGMIATVTNQSTGEVICTEAFVATMNMSKEILFPTTLPAGEYTLTISSSNKYFSGTFDVY